MAKHLVTQILDDLDGSTGARTYEFSVGLVRYEIDLAGANAAEFLADMAKWADRARLVSAGVRAPRTNPPVLVRKWWRLNARQVKDTTGLEYRTGGAIPADVHDLFQRYLDERAAHHAT